MKKKILVFLILFISVFSLSAEFGFRVGHGSILNNDDKSLGFTALTGINVGISKRIEINFEVMTNIVPSLFQDVEAGVEVGFSLLGDRIRYDGYAGSALNAVISLGLFASADNEEKIFLPTYLTLRITPATLGTVLSGRRESFLPIGLAWNFRNNSFSLFISIMTYDHYITGTWRDNK